MNILYSLFNCKLKFNPFQYIPYYKLEKTSNLYIADEVGLGKTIEAGIIIKEKLHQNSKCKFLIIAPKFLCSQWKEQLNELFNIESNILEKGSIANRYYNVYILPLSQIRNFAENKIEIENLIVDESHYFRNGNNSKRYEALKNIAEKFNTKIFMSATPINNYGSDWNNQLALLGEGYKTTNSKKSIAFPLTKIREIRTVFVTLDENERKFYNTTEDTADEEFAKTIYRHIGASSLYALNKCYENNGLDFNEEYDEIFEYFEEEENIEQYFKMKNGEEKFLNYQDSKISSLVNQISDDKLKNKKIIVFAHYLHTCEHIVSQLRANKDLKDHIFHITGNMKFYEQNSVKNRFKEHNGKAILVCSDVCKEGVNLQCASVLINYDLPFNPAILEQRIGRIDRVGQKNDIYIYNFVTEGTYDDTVYWQFLLGKLSIIQAYAKKGIINTINITDNHNEIFDFRNAVENAIKKCNNDVQQLENIYNILCKYIEQKSKKGLENKDDGEFYKISIEQLIDKIINYMKDKKQIDNINLYKKTEEKVFEKFFCNDSNNDIASYLKNEIGEPVNDNKYCFDVTINKREVKEIFTNQPSDRIFLRPLLKNADEVFQLLENQHELMNEDKIQVKEKFMVSFEYLNSSINYEEVEGLIDWDEYSKNFIPLDILTKIIVKNGESSND